MKIMHEDNLEELAARIAAYIEYLFSIDLSVSVHFAAESISRLPYGAWERLLPYNSHNNPYCLAVKSCTAEECIAHQRAIRESSDGRPTVATCYAGVTEYIFPIVNGAEAVGYVSISGYRRDSSKAYPRAAHRLADLKSEPIPKPLADTLIPPLVIMLSELVKSCEDAEPDEQNLISQYLAENHTTLTFDNLCSHFSRSRSYMSHKFAKMFGMSFSAYCNCLRLEDARRLLLLSTRPITEIAFSCGFGDVSYFIRLFKSAYGVSPLKFRKQAVTSDK